VPAPAPISVAVVVPTFARPELLARCLAALAAQQLAPKEVLVAMRAGDAETAAAVEAAAGELAVRMLTVDEPGHLPPLAAGAAAATADVVAFVDDDAEPWPDWLQSLVRHYDRPDVGAAGGLVFQPGFEDHVVADAIGKITPLGRFDRLAVHHVPREWRARDVDVLRGANMSIRGDLLAEYSWDARLNGGAATDYEVDLCSWVRRRGFRVVYDPNAIVTHRPGPRPELGREHDAQAVYAYSHNLVYVAAKALPLWQRPIAVALAFLVGSRASPGVVTALVDLAARRPPSLRRSLVPAFAGKLAGLRSAAAYVRYGAEPLVRVSLDVSLRVCPACHELVDGVCPCGGQRRDGRRA
jgi:GT2 family glycosyltransferase